MKQNTRKLVGIFAVLGSLVVHAVVFTSIYMVFLTGLPTWALLLYFAVAGMSWMFPAGYLITWMSRPDAE